MSETFENTTSKLGSPWLAPWPENELESVPACPVCGSAERAVLHEKLIDNVFFVAPGKWTLHRCIQCSSAYLDPRPSPESIGKAYGTYYTHTIGSGQYDVGRLALFRRFRRMLANGYLNHRYGTTRQPASKLGVLAAKLLLSQRQALDVQFRYLPRPTQGQRLLDVGCGNGDFLISAREAGWQVSGVEPDPKAAAMAQQRGLNVILGTTDKLTEKSGSFAAITLSHVIEHVHDPKFLLQVIYRLLEIDGVVYIDTPNIESCGARIFGANWRGMETPRHLALFNTSSLTKLLKATGFGCVKIERRTAVRTGMYLSSMRIANGNSPYGIAPVKLGWSEKVSSIFHSVNTNHLEFVTLTARKNKL